MLLFVLPLPAFAGDGDDDDDDDFETEEQAFWQEVALGASKEKCRARKRLLKIECSRDDKCIVLDTLYVSSKNKCGDSWRVPNDSASKRFGKPEMRSQLRGQKAVPIGALPCPEDAGGFGWCFEGVPKAQRLLFKVPVQARNVRATNRPGMFVRHIRFSQQDRRLTARKGITLLLAPRKWVQPVPVNVKVKGTTGLQYEIVARNRSGAQTFTGLDSSGDTSALIAAKKAGGPGDGVEVKVPGTARFVDVTYEKSGSFGLAGYEADAGVEFSGGQIGVSGGVMAEAWIGPIFGAAAGLEGSSTGGRVGARVETFAFSKAPASDKLIAMPAFGASVGLFNGVLLTDDFAYEVAVRVRGLVQFKYLGLALGLDFPFTSGPVRPVAAVSFSL